MHRIEERKCTSPEAIQRIKVRFVTWNDFDTPSNPDHFLVLPGFRTLFKTISGSFSLQRVDGDSPRRPPQPPSPPWPGFCIG
jgi:hypothetical protein